MYIHIYTALLHPEHKMAQRQTKTCTPISLPHMPICIGNTTLAPGRLPQLLHMAAEQQPGPLGVPSPDELTGNSDLSLQPSPMVQPVL